MKFCISPFVSLHQEVFIFPGRKDTTNHMTNDLTKGKPAKLIFFFAIPYLIGNLFQQFYNMADTVIVGRILGMNALAAVGATGSIVWFAMGSIQGLTTGFAAITAQRFGANDPDGIKKSFGISIVLSAVFTAILMWFCITFAMPILELLQTPEEIIKDSYNYVMWIFVGLFATTVFNLLSNMIRALGDSKTPLVFLIIACIVNIVLDIVFIYNFKMGPEGAGLATALAQFVSDILCIIYIVAKMPALHISLADLKPEKTLTLGLLKTGIPMAFLNIVLSVGGIIIQFVNNGLGTLYVATYSAANKLEQFIVQPVISFGAAVSVFAAQNYGAGEYKRIRSGINQCIVMCLAMSVSITVLMAFFGKGLIYAVAGGESAELIQNGYNYIIINSVCSIILVPLVIYKSVLQSLGRAVIPMLTGFVEVGCRALGSLVLVEYFGFIGVCFANPLAWLGAFLLIVVDYWLLLAKFKKLENA